MQPLMVSSYKIFAYSKSSLFQLVLVTTSLLVSCGFPENKDKAQPPYRSIVLDLTRVDENGSAYFGLVERTFSSLQNLDSLDGSYLRFLRGGELTVSEVNGSIVTADSFKGGEAPALRYELDRGTVVPSDYSSLAMLSSYYQFDKLYSQLLNLFGIDPLLIIEKIPNRKHTVLFEPILKFDVAGSEGSIGIKLNAAFSPQDKKFLLFQRSGVENIPLSANSQVISHEFGHFLFDYAYFDGVFDEKNYLGETFVMRGFNEGFADFVSWIVTKSPDILRSSIDIKEIADERHITKTTFNWDDVVSQSLNDTNYDAANSNKKCRDSFYCIGTLFARSLIETNLKLKEAEKDNFTKSIINALRNTQSLYKAMPESMVPKALESDTDQPQSSWARQGLFSGGFLRSFILAIDTSYRSSLCESLKSNFGSQGFGSVFRDGVCL